MHGSIKVTYVDFLSAYFFFQLDIFVQCIFWDKVKQIIFSLWMVIGITCDSSFVAKWHPHQRVFTIGAPYQASTSVISQVQLLTKSLQLSGNVLGLWRLVSYTTCNSKVQLLKSPLRALWFLTQIFYRVRVETSGADVEFKKSRGWNMGNTRNMSAVQFVLHDWILRNTPMCKIMIGIVHV